MEGNQETTDWHGEETQLRKAARIELWTTVRGQVSKLLKESPPVSVAWLRLMQLDIWWQLVEDGEEANSPRTKKAKTDKELCQRAAGRGVGRMPNESWQKLEEW